MADDIVVVNSRWAFRKGTLTGQYLSLTQGASGVIEKATSIELSKIYVDATSTLTIVGAGTVKCKDFIVLGKLTMQSCQTLETNIFAVDDGGSASVVKTGTIKLTTGFVVKNNAKLQVSNVNKATTDKGFVIVDQGNVALSNVNCDAAKAFVADKGGSTISISDCTGNWGEKGLMIGEGSTCSGNNINQVQASDTFILAKNHDSVNLKDCNNITAPNFAALQGGQNSLDGVRNVTANTAFLTTANGVNTVNNVGAVTTKQFIEDTGGRTTCTGIGSVTGVGGTLNLLGGKGSAVDWKGGAQGGSITFEDTTASLGNYQLTGTMYVKNSSIEIGNFKGSSVEVRGNSSVRIYGGSVSGTLLAEQSTVELHSIACGSIKVTEGVLRVSRVSSPIEATKSAVELNGGTANLKATECSVALNAVGGGSAELTKCSCTGNCSGVSVTESEGGVILNNCSGSAKVDKGGILANGGSSSAESSEGGVVGAGCSGSLKASQGGVVGAGCSGSTQSGQGGTLALGGSAPGGAAFVWVDSGNKMRLKAVTIFKN